MDWALLGMIVMIFLFLLVVMVAGIFESRKNKLAIWAVFLPVLGMSFIWYGLAHYCGIGLYELCDKL